MARSSSNEYRLRMQSLTKRGASRDGDRWEAWEERIILDNLDSKTDAEIALLVHRTHDAVSKYRYRFNIKKGEQLPTPTEFTLHDKCGSKVIHIAQTENRIAVYCPASTSESEIAEAFAASSYCDYYQQWRTKHVQA